MSVKGLVVVETHPVQYHAPVYRCLQQKFNIPVTVIYGSDFSLYSFHDKEFNANFAWDTDLTSGYTQVFLSSVKNERAQPAGVVDENKLKSLLVEIEPVAVLVLGYSESLYRKAFWHARRMGIPVLFRGETTDHAFKRSFVKSCLRDAVLKWFYRRCEAILYVGERSCQHFLRLGCQQKKMHFSPYCVDSISFKCGEADRSLLRPAVRKALDIPDQHRVILFSGKLSERKGVDLILKAAKILPRETRDGLTVVFLGDGELKGVLQDLANKEPKLCVRFLGFQNQTMLSQYYHSADLLVLPSRYAETWGLVVNEALHHGLPCIVSDQVGCAPDLIVPGVTGDVFASSDPVNGLASVLGQTLKWTEDRDRRTKCRDKVARYTVEKAAEGISSAYHLVCE